MSLTRVLALVLGASLFAPAALAKGAKSDKASKDDSDDAEESASEDNGSADEGGTEAASADDGEDEGKTKVKDKTKGKAIVDAPVKQDLSGHDLGTNKRENLFEKDRFFVDKVDSAKTENKTLIQGSLSSSSLVYTERGGTYGAMQGDNSAKFSRYYTELRLQTDFRHIAGGRWEARIDARARVVNKPPEDADPTGRVISADPNHVQSGFNGQNEYDVKELWLFHSGKRSDIFFGRQFVADLGGIKFDGLRVDYASSRTLTFIGFGGLYPVKGSRSITSDYPALKTDQGNQAGKLVGAAGFGGAYRTVNSYGSIGGVALIPFKGETPRIFATSTGYLRSGPTLDVYHFALVDLVSSVGAGLTNISAGVNYKPSPRLRLTANFNRVDVDTLNVQANAYLNDPQVDPATSGPNVIQNETYFRRLSTNVGRVGVSAGLGQLQRFEVTLQGAYRYRPKVALDTPGAMGIAVTTTTLDAAKGVDLYAAITDRRSFKDLRLGVDVSRSIGLGDVAFQRSEVFAVRGSAARELANGHGEWEAEVSYASTKDSAKGFACSPLAANTPNTCFGSSNGAIYSAGGTLFYRVNRDWMAIGTLFLTHQTLTHNDVTPAMPNMVVAKQDPAVNGVIGFARISYRF